MYKIENSVITSKPKSTYQKANGIVKNFLKKDANRINLLKHKVEEKFELIHYIYSSLFSNIYNRTSQFRIKKKLILILIFKLGNPENKMVQQQQDLYINYLQTKQNK